MVKDEDVRMFLEDNEEKVTAACALLRESNCSIYRYLADIVASICDVDTQRMMCVKRSVRESQARWFYWYCRRYLTNDTYEGLSEISKRHTFFSTPAIAYSVSKMSMMVSQEYVWQRRWNVMKRVIKAMKSDFSDTSTITLSVKTPKGVNVQLKQE